ncbi:phosphate ABC transporter ATP-binding protein PstB [Sulfobacillus harzensis]|uniref:Phosphate ABC transporter ATP-binding protein n=1 Tax=Sulfobacillus harzensis TaxID=2729629 RepID=A0A7Y0Q2Q4_9FIRM|nr:phosphate ABC transporter ATP-binding protein PstB [Sulfobacillus harzensis]NMP22141.1 phosphate ABC transporter ATP-binding protein [Sulfobacillus harzensis]
MAPEIRVEGLSVWYDRQRALKDVSLNVRPGTVMALIGPSGCGKSTFLRAINRLIEESTPRARVQGHVQVGDIDVYHPSTDVNDLRRRVGMVFQLPNPFPFSIFDNVAYGPRLQGVRDGRTLRRLVENSLKQAALWDEVRGKLRRPALALSGGQQQRLCIARALAVNPDVLLMDEPTASLDPLSTSKIEELVADLRGRYTIILVTHNLRQAARISDHTAFFSNGMVIETGDTRQIFTAPREQQTEEYLTGRYED